METLEIVTSDRALIVAHNIIILVLAIQNTYFKLQLDKDIEERKNDFVSIWGRQKAFDLENKI